MKIKCDERQPTCGACERKKTTCVYEFPLVIYNPYQSKKKKAGKAAKDSQSKVSKDGSSQQHHQRYKLKPEDKRILQITLPSEFKFVTERFDDETSSSSSTASPKTAESQVQTSPPANVPAPASSRINKQYDLLKSNPDIENAFGLQMKLSESNLHLNAANATGGGSKNININNNNANSAFSNHSINVTQAPANAPVLPSSAVAAPANTNLDSIKVKTEPLDVDWNSVKLEEFDWNNMLSSDDLFQETLRIAQGDGGDTVASLETQPLPELIFNFYTENNVNFMRKYFAKAQPIIDARKLTAEDTEIQNLIWTAFIKGKALSNHLFVDDDFHDNHLINWLRVLSRNNPDNYNIISTSITAATSNGIYLQTDIHYWYVVKEKYMDITISILSQYIDSSNSFVLMTCLLFTVLLLYSERSGTDSPVWRLHLRGALGILKKITTVWSLQELHAIPNKSEDLSAAINLFHFCECWFSAAESLAWISSINGGSMPCESQTDLIDARGLLFNHLKYESSNPLVVGGFNTIRFYQQSLVEVMNEVVLHIMSLKVNYDIDLTELNGLLLNQPPTMESYYLGQKLLKRLGEVEFEEFEFSGCKDKKLAGTMRITAKCYFLGIKSYILSNFMGYDINHPEIQQSIPRFIEQFSQMPYANHCAISVHWACYFLACCTPPDKQLRRQILRPLDIMISQTMLAATYSIKRIEQIWHALDTKDYRILRKIDTICFWVWWRWCCLSAIFCFGYILLLLSQNYFFANTFFRLLLQKILIHIKQLFWTVSKR